MSRPVLAAGAIPWRLVDGEVMVLLIHRTKHKDVSFPKGKVDPGESVPQAGVREIEEETGLRVALGANLGTVHYAMPGGGEKTVQYWAAHATETAITNSSFVPNREVEALEWVTVKQARKKLSYPADRDILDVFVNLSEHNARETFSVILLRHAKAEPRSERFPEDRLRPLSDLGEDQADTLVPTLAAFGPARILSSSAERCLRTATPIAQHLNKAVRVYDGLSQDAWESGDLDALRGIIGKVVRRGKNTIICTHRPVLPDAARELALATGSLTGSYLREAVELPPGGFSVFHFSKTNPGAGILGVEVYPVKP